jgi:hypothetical protein
MVMNKLFMWLVFNVDAGFLPLGMVVFTLGKLACHLMFEGRVSFGSVRFLFAYIAIIPEVRKGNIALFIQTFLGIGVIY